MFGLFGECFNISLDFQCFRFAVKRRPALRYFYWFKASGVFAFCCSIKVFLITTRYIGCVTRIVAAIVALQHVDVVVCLSHGFLAILSLPSMHSLLWIDFFSLVFCKFYRLSPPF